MLFVSKNTPTFVPKQAFMGVNDNKLTPHKQNNQPTMVRLSQKFPIFVASMS